MINTIRYMGSKRKILKEIYKISKDFKRKIFIDLFAGSGVVSLNAPYKDIISNDIQNYSKIIIQGATHSFEKSLYISILKKWSEHKSSKKIGFIEENYSEIFFSKKQSQFLDWLRDYAENSKNKILIQYIGIKMMFIMQNSPGHFASFLKKSERSTKLLKKDPLIVLKQVYKNWEFNDKKIKTFSKESIECIVFENSVYYMDPPYTVDQYSRFYHLLETFVLNDQPKLLNNKSKYRENRYKSDFSSKSLSKIAFSKHFKLISERNSDIVLSYYENGIVSIEYIISEMKKYFKNVKMKKINYKHSSLGGQPKYTKEILMWGTNE